MESRAIAQRLNQMPKHKYDFSLRLIKTPSQISGDFLVSGVFSRLINQQSGKDNYAQFIYNCTVCLWQASGCFALHYKSDVHSFITICHCQYALMLLSTQTKCSLEQSFYLKLEFDVDCQQITSYC